MSRWYAALKKLENADIQNPQKVRNPDLHPSEPFEGSISGTKTNSSCTADRSPNGVLNLLRVPHLGKSENFQSDAGGSVSFVSSANERIENFATAAKSLPDPTQAHVDPRSDADQYAEALRQIGPCGYGPIAVVLSWGMTRTANAEEALRKARRIVYDKTGRGRLV